jgi:hypothetical protein
MVDAENAAFEAWIKTADGLVKFHPTESNSAIQALRWARAAWNARAAIAPAGCAWLPLEPTEAMVHAAEDLPVPRMFGKVWRAMAAAAAMASRPAALDEPEDLLLAMWNLGYRPGEVVEQDYGKPWARRAIIKKVYENGNLDLEVDGEVAWSSVHRCMAVNGPAADGTMP